MCCSQPLVSSEWGHKVLEVLVVRDCTDSNQQLCARDSAQARQQVPTSGDLAFSVSSLLGETRSSQMLKESLELWVARRTARVAHCTLHSLCATHVTRDTREHYTPSGPMAGVAGQFDRVDSQGGQPNKVSREHCQAGKRSWFRPEEADYNRHTGIRLR